MDDREYRYDAFISYRHLPLETAVAQRLQRLLEGYAAPRGADCAHARRIERVFVDTSEMPNIPDLTSGIEEALAQSRYLIVLCSEALLESAWCHREVTRFKQLQDGSAARIIPVLVSGDPARAEGEPSRVFFPEMLCTDRVHTDAAGKVTRVREAIEPLYTDIRADTPRGTLRRLARERLRIAAPLLGCAYDDLYRRHRRRAIRRRAAASCAALAVAAGVGAAGIHLDAGRRDASALLLQRQASEAARAGDAGLGMRYLVDSLAQGPRDAAPQAAGLSLLLQRAAWPVRVFEGEGAIAGDAVLHDGAALGHDAAAGLTLAAAEDGYVIYDAQGEVLARVHGAYMGQGPGGCFVLRQAGGDGVDTYAIWTPGEDALRPLTLAREPSEDAYSLTGEDSALVCAYDGGERVVAAYPARLEFYRYDGAGYALEETLAREALFAPLPGQEDSGLAIAALATDPAGRMLAATDGRRVTVLALESRAVLLRVEQTARYVHSIAFSREARVAQHLAIGYGMPRTADIEQGGGFEVWSLLRRERIAGSEGVLDMPVAQVRFGEAAQLLATLGHDGQAALWRLSDGALEAVLPPIAPKGQVTAAVPGGEGLLTVATADGGLIAYGALMPAKSRVADLRDDRLPLLAVAPEPDGLWLLTEAQLVRVGAQGGEVLEQINRADARYADFLRERAPQLQDKTLLYAKMGVERMPGWIEAAAVACVLEDLHAAGGQAQAGSLVEALYLTEDGARVYAIGSAQPFVACYDVDGQAQALALREMTAFEAGTAPVALFGAGDGVALCMAGGEVRLYGAQGLAAPRATLSAPRAGRVQEVATDAAGQYVAAVLAPEDGGEQMLLIWHAPSQTLLLAQGFGGDALGALCFGEDCLYYARGSALYRIMLQKEAPTEGRAAFLDALCGYAMDGQGIAQRVTPPDARALEAPADGWERLYTLVTDVEQMEAQR